MECMSNRQDDLLDFVKIMHKRQVRKYTNEPYVNHLLNVAKLADSVDVVLGFEIGLCHDLFEDTTCDYTLLRSFLLSVGYSQQEASFILHGVEDLTDAFTKDNYPDFNRAKRKAMEAERLWTIPPMYQTVKYSDLIDNTSSIVEYDPKFAEKYLEEKRYILKGMDKGHQGLYSQAMALVVI